MVVARHDMAQWPLIGAMTSNLGMIFVNRDRFDVMPDVAMQMERALKAGYTVVMFPEATTSKGNNLLPFKAPLFEPAVRVGVPVHYGCLHYSTAPSEPPASDVVNWWRDVSFAAHAWTYLQTPYINARLRYGTDCILADNRKQLARKLQDAVQTLFEPM
jgi:1-acyl-sn-glycerol-3-phosphate acyltransferase